MNRGAAERHNDWIRPGAHRVAEGVHRLPLPLPPGGLPAVNSYVVEAVEGIVLIDSGWAFTQGAVVLAESLRSIGYHVEDVVVHVATHGHWDHASQALSLRARLGTPVAMGRQECPMIEAYDEHSNPYQHQLDQLRAAGADDVAAAIAVRPPLPDERGLRLEPADLWLSDADRIPVRGGDLEIIETPGHTRGHISIRYSARDLMFTGDHTLPDIAPIVGLENVSHESALATYLASLGTDRLGADAVMLPGHGHPGRGVRARADELLAHWERRLAEVQSHVDTQHTTAYEVAFAMRWDRAQRELHLLDVVRQMTAILEIANCLELLSERGAIRQSPRCGAGLLHYAPN